MRVQFNDKLLIKTKESDYRWSRVTDIIRDVFIIPVYVVEILDGPRAGESVHVDHYLDHAKAGVFISHEFSGTVNG